VNSIGASPSSVAPGGQVLLVVAVTIGANPTSTGIVVTGNLGLIGGSATQRFYDDGTNGDEFAGDNRFSYSATISSGSSSGSKTLPVGITDAQSRSSSSSIQVFVTAIQTSDARQLIFPHIADGMGFKTELLLTNGSDIDTTATLLFFSDTGDPLNISIGNSTASAFTFPIPARGSAMISTLGSSSSFSGGWARITSSPPANLNGNAIFQSFNVSDLLSEASVPATPPVSSARFYADEEGGFNTGIAYANPGPVKAIGTLTLRNLSGTFIDSEPIDLDPGHHSSLFLYQIFSGAPSGSAEISLTSGSLSITTLRIHSSGIFSTVTVSYTPVSALFSPDGGVRSQIISEINKAHSSIDIAIYSFTADEIREALVAAKDRGVAIRIIADSSQANGTGSEIGTLESLGFDVKRMSGESGGIMHNKYMIIDSSILLTGSYNWSANAEDNNFENAIFIQGVSVIQDYVADFERIWEK
jgi:hypothetical protein